MGQLGVCLDPLGAILGPSWASLGPSSGHHGAASGHPKAILKSILASKRHRSRGKTRKGQQRTSSAKIARRLGESTIFKVPKSLVKAFLGKILGILCSSWALGAIFEPSSGLLGPSWGILRPSWRILGPTSGILRPTCSKHCVCARARVFPEVPPFAVDPRLLPAFSPASPRLHPFWGLGKNGVFHKNHQTC